MILSELKDYMQKRRVVNIAELVQRFDVSPAVLREMLDFWIRKGKARKVDPATARACKKCAQCQMQSMELYEWLD